MVNGPANRTLLSKKILKFCGAFPIYNTEIFNNPVYENGYASKTNTNLHAYAECWPNVVGAFYRKVFKEERVNIRVGVCGEGVGRF